MPKRKLTIAWFHIRVFATKLLVILVSFPIGLVMIPVWTLQGTSNWGQFKSLFSGSEWHDMFENSIECLVGCRWFLVDAKIPNDEGSMQTPHSYWYVEEQLACFLFLEDAVLMNMMMGGTLTKKPWRKNNAQSQSKA